MDGRRGASLESRAYVGTLVGESTSREFRLAIAAEATREQDIIAVDAELGASDPAGERQRLRVWAKVQRIERLNPLFPAEAGQELADTRTDPFETVLSLSREMVTAVCQVLGAEPIPSPRGGRLDHVRYPPQPASSAYRPAAPDLARVLLGTLDASSKRALDVGTLANRPEVPVVVDGHTVVTRHLAILAMTGAGKTWTARRIIEQLAAKHYPIVIFDPRGDYTGLADVPELAGRVKRYYAQFPLFDEDAETAAHIVGTLGYPLSDTMQARFGDVFDAARSFYVDDEEELVERTAWLAEKIGRDDVVRYGLKPDMYLVARLAEVGELLLRRDDDEGKRQLQEWGWSGFVAYSKGDARTLEGIKKRAFRAARSLRLMEQTNQKVAASAEPLPRRRTELVDYGRISVVSLAGYSDDFRATIYSIIADEIFQARLRDELAYPALLVLEEAHNFVPAGASTAAVQRATTVTKQIAQEGRKFGLGLLLISQRPSRLDATTLSQCNSFVVMRMVNPADQKFVRDVIETLGEDDAGLLPDLDVGEALLSGQFVNFPVLARVSPPASKGEREEEDAFEVLDRARRSVGVLVRERVEDR